jgi:GNAT superfamily N-acetyltransferase
MMEFLLYTGTLKHYLPEWCNLYESIVNTTDGNIVLYYISTRLLDSTEYDMTTLPMVGFIDTMFNSKHSQLEICYLRSNVRHKGIGTLLLYIALLQAREAGLKHVILDDDSDNYRKPNNIYLKLGFKYAEEYGPEMYGNIEEICNKFEQDAEKYNWSNIPRN